MKLHKVFASLFVFALIFASGVTPSKANGFAEGRGFSITVADFPDAVDRGARVAGTITVEMFPATPIVQQRASYQIFVTTPLGDAPVQSGTFPIRPGRTRTIKVDIPVDETAAPGAYSMKIVITSGAEVVSVGHDLTVR
jgi:hypothetical protein